MFSANLSYWLFVIIINGRNQIQIIYKAIDEHTVSNFVSVPN